MTEVPASPEVASEAAKRAAFDALDEKYGPRYYDMDGKPMSFWDWAMNYELQVNRHVGDTCLKIHGHVFRVSTVLLGLDHGFSMNPNRRPIIFETMVFQDGGDMSGFDGICERYCTKEEARAGHRRIVRWVRRNAALIPKPKQLISHGRKP